jgi:dedicator of cytokinesis protein 3
LGTAINGAVDSPVQGGVKLYRQTFLDPTYETTHPEQKEDIEILRAEILEYASVIDQALDLHAQVCKDTAFHEALRSREFIVSPKSLVLTTRFHPLLSRRDCGFAKVGKQAIWSTSPSPL